MNKKILLFILMLLPSAAYSARISASPVVEIEGVTVGKECVARPVRRSIFIKNKGNGPVSVKITKVQPDETLLIEGFEPLPLSGKVSISKDSLFLMPGEIKTVDVYLHIPRNHKLLSRKFQFHINFSVTQIYGDPMHAQNDAQSNSYIPNTVTSGVGVYPGVESIMLFSTLDKMAVTEVEQDIGAGGGKIEDKDVFDLDIPAGALDKNVKIKVKELTGDDIPKKNGLDETSQAVIVFKFSPDGITFNKPVKVRMYYADFDDDGIVDGLEVKAEDLKIFYWNGLRWDPVGGKVDKVAKCVSAELNHFSIYGVFNAGQTAPTNYTPLQKIITPVNLDGINDFISFPGLQGIYQIDIFDISGMKVVRLENRNIWNGTDEDGNFVESGAYIYKYTVDINGTQKTITGVVVVAK
ncbi:MAG: gliding motility-associated C-terminal domain-containing protein [Elusimicrobiota bacterium]